MLDPKTAGGSTGAATGARASGGPRDAEHVPRQHPARYRRGQPEDRQGCFRSRLASASAIQAANAKPHADTIILPAGTFTMTIPPTGNDDASTGDLDINGSVTIKGARAGLTIIDGNHLDRVFTIVRGAVAISDITIENGLALSGAGGGVFNGGGNVTLTNVDVEHNVAMGIDNGNGVTGVSHGAVGNPGGAGVEGAMPREAAS